MRRAAKVDLNHVEVGDRLRAAGCSVQSLVAVADGCPDYLVGYRGRTYLLEVKGPKGRLTPDQVEWHGRWRGAAPAIVRSPEEALRVVMEGL